jgi:glyoxylase-like metal-dependent hydrolase (beta-lactamase superfamily II)
MSQATSSPPSLEIGDIQIIALSDGLLPVTNAMAVGITQAEATRLSGIPEGGEVTIPVNSFLLKFRDKMALVDTGSSDTQGPTLGFLIPRLGAIGVTAAMIDYIFITHAHPDHTNGLLSPKGEVNFPNAELIMHEREANFWLEREPHESDSERLKKGTAASRRTILPYRERLRKVRDGEIMNGISAISSNGHTPGHTAYAIHAGREGLIFWGDTVHVEAIQVPRPDVVMVYDLDQDMARKSRMDMFERVITENLAIAGAHVGDGKFMRLQRRGAGYAMEENK